MCQFLKRESEHESQFDGQEESKDGLTSSETGHTYEALKVKFTQALDYNLKLVKRDRKGVFENNCASYFMSAKVGMNTIAVTDTLEQEVMTTA